MTTMFREERVGEPAIFGVGNLVQGLPGDEHGHDDRLARAGCHLHRDAGESRVRCCADLPEPGFDPVIADLLGGLGQENERLQGFNLAEEELVLPVRAGPVLQELAGNLGDASYSLSRQSLTRCRIRLTLSLGSMRSWVHSVSNWSCLPFFLGGGIGTKQALARRVSTISLVIPSSVNRQCRSGSRKGELRIRFSMIVSGMAASAISSTGVHHRKQSGLSQ